jgi:nucleoside-diphosphate-sugar epimerase
MMPLIGNSAGVWSFIHVEDAAVATVAAVEGGPKGAYNIADDAPVAVSTWLPALATILGARKPLHIPKWIGRMLVGDVGISLLTRVQGVSNGKAKAELRWQPTYRDWRSGFSAVLERPSHNTPRS